jgi:hypothetical protein
VERGYHMATSLCIASAVSIFFIFEKVVVATRRGTGGIGQAGTAMAASCEGPQICRSEKPDVTFR